MPTLKEFYAELELTKGTPYRGAVDSFASLLLLVPHANQHCEGLGENLGTVIAVTMARLADAIGADRPALFEDAMRVFKITSPDRVPLNGKTDGKLN